MKNENEVNISDSDPDSQEMSPSQIYTMYKKGYKYAYVQQVQEGGEALDVIELSPENRQNDVFKVRLKVRKKDASVKKLADVQEERQPVYLLHQEISARTRPSTTSTFAFDKTKYKGVKVVDLR
ncbi:MAG: hypothetical protein WKG07_33665 [Hymenobacter sp.]